MSVAIPEAQLVAISQTLASRLTLGAWSIDQIAPDRTVHPNVEIRDLAIDPRGPRLVHVRILPGGKIIGTVHDDEHESVLVLKGSVNADINGAIIPGEPNTVFNIPRGIVHGYLPQDRKVVELLAAYAPAIIPTDPYEILRKHEDVLKTFVLKYLQNGVIRTQLALLSGMDVRTLADGCYRMCHLTMERNSTTSRNTYFELTWLPAEALFLELAIHHARQLDHRVMPPQFIPTDEALDALLAIYHQTEVQADSLTRR